MSLNTLFKVMIFFGYGHVIAFAISKPDNIHLNALISICFLIIPGFLGLIVMNLKKVYGAIQTIAAVYSYWNQVNLGNLSKETENAIKGATINKSNEDRK